MKAKTIESKIPIEASPQKENIKIKATVIISIVMSFKAVNLSNTFLKSNEFITKFKIFYKIKTLAGLMPSESLQLFLCVT